MTLDPKIEALAQWLHDEVDYPDPDFPNHSWPEHPDDTGQRGDGWLKIVPKDIQEQFRGIARRLARSALLPASAEPVAWRREHTVTCATKDRLPDDFTDNADLAELWRGHPQTVTVTPLYASPPASGALEAGWRIERMLEIIAEAFGLVQALDKRHGPNEIARCQSNLISVLSYEDWTIPADFDELKRLLNRPAAPTEGR